MSEHELKIEKATETIRKVIAAMDFERWTVQMDDGKSYKIVSRSEVKTIAEELLILRESAEKTDERNDWDAKLEKAVGYYTALSKAECYAAAKSSGDPMLYACKTRWFDTIKVKPTKDKDNKDVVLWSIEDSHRNIDLIDLDTNNKAAGGIGRSIELNGKLTNWKYVVEYLHALLIYRAFERSGKPIPMDSINMHDIARAINMGKTPLSNTNIARTFQYGISAMLGDEYKINAKDIHVLLDTFAKVSKKTKAGISLASKSGFYDHMAAVCHRIITGAASYDVECKEVKGV